MEFDHIFIHPSNFDESRSFYIDRLGLSEVANWGGDGEPRGAVLKSGSFSVTVAERHADDTDNAWTHGVDGRKPTIHLNVSDLPAAFDKVGKGEHIAIEPEKTHWGTDWFVVKDPDGNLVAVNSTQG